MSAAVDVAVGPVEPSDPLLAIIPPGSFHQPQDAHLIGPLIVPDELGLVRFQELPRWFQRFLRD
jgi:hypothetical protein